jgi:hypothetical protein
MKNIAKACLFIVAVMLLAVIKINAQVSVGVGISATIGPPPLPVYVQPPCPVEGYLWEPGYWAYDDADGDYYWVPGVWVAPPNFGLLWTPCYWGYSGNVYVFHEGYWGPQVGFYGGIDYGFGYFGSGFAGGRWEGRSFRYNTAVVNVNTTVIRNTYRDPGVINNRTVVNNNRLSYNGPGGVNVRPRPAELQAMRERHVRPTNEQLTHQQVARKDRNQFASVNHGRPTIAAMNRVNGNRFTPQGRPATPKAAERMHAAGNRRSQPNMANAGRGNNAGMPHQGKQANNAIHQQRMQTHQRSQQHAQSQQRMQPQQRAHMQAQQRAQQHAQQQRAHMQAQHHMQQRTQQQQRTNMQAQQHMQQRAQPQHVQQRAHMQPQQRAQQPHTQQRAYAQPQHMQPRMQQPQRMQQPRANPHTAQPRQKQRQ